MASTTNDNTPAAGGPAQPVYVMNANVPTSTASGSSDAVTIANGADVAEGLTTDAAITTDATGTVSAKLRGLVKWAFERMPASLGQKTKAASLPVTIASDQDTLATSTADGANVAIGTTTGAAVVTDATGTLQQYLRGLTKIIGLVWDSTNNLLNANISRTGSTALDSTNKLPVSLYGNNGAAGDTSIRVFAITSESITAGNGLVTFSVPKDWNGAAFTMRRNPNIFKTVTATSSGDTAVWTPTSGKKFRAMSYSIEVTADAATSGGADIDIVLRDATAAVGAGMTAFVPAVAGTGFGNNISSGWRTLGNGVLSAAANQVLNVNLSAALTAGKVRVNVAGTEE